MFKLRAQNWASLAWGVGALSLFAIGLGILALTFSLNLTGLALYIAVTTSFFIGAMGVNLFQNAISNFFSRKQKSPTYRLMESSDDDEQQLLDENDQSPDPRNIKWKWRSVRSYLTFSRKAKDPRPAMSIGSPTMVSESKTDVFQGTTSSSLTASLGVLGRLPSVTSIADLDDLPSVNEQPKTKPKVEPMPEPASLSRAWRLPSVSSIDTLTDELSSDDEIEELQDVGSMRSFKPDFLQTGNQDFLTNFINTLLESGDIVEKESIFTDAKLVDSLKNISDPLTLLNLLYIGTTEANRSAMRASMQAKLQSQLNDEQLVEEILEDNPFSNLVQTLLKEKTLYLLENYEQITKTSPLARTAVRASIANALQRKNCSATLGRRLAAHPYHKVTDQILQLGLPDKLANHLEKPEQAEVLKQMLDQDDLFIGLKAAASNPRLGRATQNWVKDQLGLHSELQAERIRIDEIVKDPCAAHIQYLLLADGMDEIFDGAEDFYQNAKHTETEIKLLKEFITINLEDMGMSKEGAAQEADAPTDLLPSLLNGGTMQRMVKIVEQDTSALPDEVQTDLKRGDSFSDFQKAVKSGKNTPVILASYFRNTEQTLRADVSSRLQQECGWEKNLADDLLEQIDNIPRLHELKHNPDLNWEIAQELAAIEQQQKINLWPEQVKHVLKKQLNFSTVRATMFVRRNNSTAVLERLVGSGNLSREPEVVEDKQNASKATLESMAKQLQTAL